MPGMKNRKSLASLGAGLGVPLHLDLVHVLAKSYRTCLIPTCYLLGDYDMDMRRLQRQKKNLEFNDAAPS